TLTEIERAETLIEYNNLYSSKIKPAKLLLDLNKDALVTFHTTKSNLFSILEIINHKKEKIIDEMGLQSILNLEAY
ncbi:MAG: hypothetical protein ACOC14_01390, partial [Bacillota bacterium]